MDIYRKSLKMHEENKGKIEIVSKVKVSNKDELSLAYSPGVAEPCRKIAEDENNIFKYTSKGNMVAVITDGSAVLGLGNIGPKAALPVMEGKSILFKKFGNVDSFPLCLDTQDTEEIINICKNLTPSLGGINLEDISAPRCVEIERRLIEELHIPVFHDDQHGTAIIVTAALLNACKLTGKNSKELKVVVSGAGAAGSSIVRMIYNYGVGDIISVDIDGIINSKRENFDFLQKEILEITNKDDIEGDLSVAMKNADVFIGVSASNIVSREMIKSMNDNPFVFAMANPVPEIMPEEAKKAGARIIGTGRSDYPNQINNVLAFPGIFRGALDVGAKKINEEMKLAAAYAIASVIDEKELREDYIVPSPFDERVVQAVAEAVAKKAVETGVVREK
ncbi:NAD(P)-dependent malic enzyme [Vallitalea sp.]|jgi:malate dehydrogenase (oxaloacetate-decarboxylating)|uniref:NAD(P)-dependent malic enzyme n=1 Tax=Vallitalea sp. TaxID=1882829 RepID=UPI0025F58629|nr:malic enzyme-like NAD(P)-binding protein [Vallitalea sp.]MCT4686025.1 NAD-dependent malic enzyme [Vallitalea sp.]